MINKNNINKKSYENIAKYYDILCTEEKTQSQIKFIKRIFALYKKNVEKVLDVGCATGRHSIPLAKEGFKIVGVDISKNLIDVAKKKSKNYRLNVKFKVGDMKKIKFNNKFDAIICLFTVFNHNLSKKGMIKTLKNFYNSLDKGGILILDTPNFKLDIKEFKEFEINEYHKNGKRALQIFKYSHDKRNRFWTTEEFDIIKGNNKIYTITQKLFFRITTYSEIVKMLKRIGFKNINCFGDFKNLKKMKYPMNRFIFVANK